MTELPARLLLITDRHQAKLPLARVVGDSVDAGVRWVLFRDREMERTERLALGRDVAAAVRRRGGFLSVGGDPEIAAELGADGIHVQSPAGVDAARRRLGAHCLVGLSAHSRADLDAAAAVGADYATISPIYLTASKPGYGPALGPEFLREASTLGVPLVALAGIDAATAPICLAAGASAVAVMGEVMRSSAPAETTARLLAAFQDAGRPCRMPRHRPGTKDRVT